MEKPYEQMDDLGGKPHYFLETSNWVVSLTVVPHGI